MNKNFCISVLTIITTYIITRIIYRLTGFSYSFSDGILNIKLLIDISLWIAISLLVGFILNKVLSKHKE